MYKPLWEVVICLELCGLKCFIRPVMNYQLKDDCFAYLTPPARHTYVKQHIHMQLMDASFVLYLIRLT